MNERIQELHQQAKDYINEVSDKDGVYQGKEYMQAVREKFAELIVRECAGVAWGIYANQEIANGIKQHFGVE